MTHININFFDHEDPLFNSNNAYTNIASYAEYLSCLILKGRTFLLQVMETQTGMECWDSILNLTLSTTRMAELSAPHAGCNLPPWKFLSTHSCQGLSAPPGLFNANKEISPLKISKDPKPPILWCSASSNCKTAKLYMRFSTGEYYPV